MIRQGDRCALCNAQGSDLGTEFAHHVIPNQCGNPADPGHAWLREPVNCVMLCDGCHEHVHESGRFRAGSVAPPGAFVYSHGARRSEHRRWADGLDRRAAPVWRYVELKGGGR